MKKFNHSLVKALTQWELSSKKFISCLVLGIMANIAFIVQICVFFKRYL